MVMSPEVKARFWTYVQKGAPADCWPWTGAHVPEGYGAFDGSWCGVSQIGAHRVSWMLANGEIPTGAHVHHVCRVKGCVNPAHLKLRTPIAHAHEEGGFVPAQIAATHCPQGHPYNGPNLYVTPKGKRACRECMRASNRRWRADHPRSAPQRRSRLTAEQADAIRASTARGIDIAAQYGISKAYVSEIRKGTKLRC